MTLKELFEKRAQLATRIRKIADQAKDREFTEDEQRDWDSANQEYDQLSRRIERGGRLEEIGDGRTLPGREDRAGDDGTGRQLPEELRFLRCGDRAERQQEDGVEWWENRETGRRLPVLTGRTGSFARALARSDEDLDPEAPRIGDLACALLRGARSDQERRALTEWTGEGGGVFVPDRLAAQTLDLFRSRLVLSAAGVRMVPMDSASLTLPKVATDPTVTWLDDNIELSSSDPTFTFVRMVTRTLKVLVKVPRDLIEDASNVGGVVEGVIAAAGAVELDRAVLHGGNGYDPTGLIDAITNIHDMGAAAGAALAAYDPFVSAIQLVEDDNAPAPMVAIMAPRTAAEISKLKDQQDNPLLVPPMLRDVRMLRTTAIGVADTHGTAENASKIILGGFGEVAIGVRTRMKIELLKERFAEFGQYAFLLRARFASAVLRPEALARIDGIIPPT